MGHLKLFVNASKRMFFCTICMNKSEGTGSLAGEILGITSNMLISHTLMICILNR